MMSHALAIAAAGCAGGLVGWFVVPWLAAVLLGRAYRRARTWWWDSLASYRAFKRAHPQREPSSHAAGTEGSLGLWRVQTLRDAQVGTLPVERVRALVETGCVVDAAEPVRCEAEQEVRCSFRAKRWHRALAAVGGAAAGFGIAWWMGATVPAAALAVACATMAAAAICDMRARIVPLETCATIAVAGVVFQASTVGLEGVLVGCVFAALVVLCCLVANRLFGKTGRTPVGYGDVRCMAALSLASGFAAPVGAALCYGSAAAFSLVGIALGRLSWRSGIPMAPFLAVWLVGGAFTCVCGMG